MIRNKHLWLFRSYKFLISSKAVRSTSHLFTLLYKTKLEIYLRIKQSIPSPFYQWIHDLLEQEYRSNDIFVMQWACRDYDFSYCDVTATTSLLVFSITTSNAFFYDNYPTCFQSRSDILTFSVPLSEHVQASYFYV